MQDTDWQPSPCPTCGEMREAAEHPVCENSSCSSLFKIGLNHRAEVSPIIVYEGREYDLTKLEMPCELLKTTAKPVYDALTSWPHGIEYWSYAYWQWFAIENPDWYPENIYRAKPAPKKPVIKTRHGVCFVEMTDGYPGFGLLAYSAATHGHWIATLEDDKPVEIIWKATK